MLILTLSCRNDSMHYLLYDWEMKREVAAGSVERLGTGSCITMSTPGKRARRREVDCRNHTGALAALLDTLTDQKTGVLKDLGGIRGVGHRVVNGGERFGAPVLISPETLPLLKETLLLAPQLNAPCLEGIEAGQELLSPLPQVALFETSFHRTMPEVAYLYPVPLEWYEKHRIRRYGFHGYAHLYAARRGAELLGLDLESSTLITVHVGEGASLCLVRNGASVETSMGFSPLQGLMMENGCGDIDAGIIPFIIEEEKLTPQEMDEILAKRSGSVGIAGAPVNGPAMKKEFRRSPRGRLALEMEGYRLKKYLGAYIAIGNPAAIVFSYSEGWADWPARAFALKDLEPFGIRLDAARDKDASAGGREVVISAENSRLPVVVLPSGEDLLVNAEVATVLGWS
ncbi:acetate/propionate family kinase [Geomonas sp. RF6]|uniref:acetate/propionate family kinase n=1 Tax=Geomonas sp. RF6 TaxID=2897342 RepID=UPI001E469D7F|nr:acetate/propionate family kinase [Geomonas sp. RF6]UFS72611.1 acetate/propionate family kinase [Geomonas sp. RF6]